MHRTDLLISDLNSAHVQLTLDNALAPYLNTQFGFSITKAGNLAAIFGMMNFGARPAGGVLSDVLGKRFGMRGRIWALFLVFSLGGFFTAMTGVLAFHPFKVTLAMYILAGIFLEVRPQLLTTLFPLPLAETLTQHCVFCRQQLCPCCYGTPVAHMCCCSQVGFHLIIRATSPWHGLCGLAWLQYTNSLCTFVPEDATG